MKRILKISVFLLVVTLLTACSQKTATYAIEDGDMRSEIELTHSGDVIKKVGLTMEAPLPDYLLGTDPSQEELKQMFIEESNNIPMDDNQEGITTDLSVMDEIMILKMSIDLEKVDKKFLPNFFDNNEEDLSFSDVSKSLEDQGFIKK